MQLFCGLLLPSVFTSHPNLIQTSLKWRQHNPPKSREIIHLTQNIHADSVAGKLMLKGSGGIPLCWWQYIGNNIKGTVYIAVLFIISSKTTIVSTVYGHHQVIIKKRLKIKNYIIPSYRYTLWQVGKTDIGRDSLISETSTQALGPSGAATNLAPWTSDHSPAQKS
jgi:hypothetical protein